MRTEQVKYRVVDEDTAYRVGSDGSVWSRCPRGKAEKWRRLNPFANKKGYLRVRFRDRKLRLLNRLVCAAFHGEPPTARHEAAHLDGGLANNAASNLAWKTPTENAADMVLHGTVNRGEKNGQHKLTEISVREMREARRAGKSQQALVEQFGVGQGEVSMVLSGKRWRWLK
jgi:hypothetical protein